MKNYCAVRQATDDNILRSKRKRFAGGITQAKTQTRTYKLNDYHS